MWRGRWRGTTRREYPIALSEAPGCDRARRSADRDEAMEPGNHILFKPTAAPQWRRERLLRGRGLRRSCIGFAPPRPAWSRFSL
ncbi:hypothetical protein LC55x_2047 [Lysobacter capsici]|nr:hypothetical protein LC55x_2047 [Lysobacter capsici]